MTLFDKTNKLQSKDIKRGKKSIEDNLKILIEIDDKNNITHSNEIENLFILQKKQKCIFNIQNIKLFQFGINIIIKLCIEHHFSIETLSSTIYFFKCIISQCDITETNLNAVIFSIFYLRAKYEELTVPIIDEIAYKSGLTKEQFIKLESKILNLLKYDLNFISGINFIRYLTKMNFYNQRDHKLSKFIYTITFYFNIKYSENEISISSYFLALKILNRNSDWIHLYSKCNKHETIKISNFITKYLFNEINLKEFKDLPIYKMFNNKENYFVSRFLYDFLCKFKLKYKEKLI